jgi:hypothetical protein
MRTKTGGTPRAPSLVWAVALVAVVCALALGLALNAAADDVVTAKLTHDSVTTEYKGGDGLVSALENAQSSDLVTVVGSPTLSASATVPEGVTLLVPCMDDDPGYVENFCPSTDDTSIIPSKVACYSTLTIPSGVTMTVNGTLLVNAITGPKSGTSEQGNICGGYGQIALDGVIDVTGSKAVLDNFGYITGSGSVNATGGGKVGDRYEVTNWRGGSNASTAVGSSINVYPMNETNCHSIQTTVTIDSSASFIGLVRMYEGWFGYHEARFQLIGGLGSMIQLSSGAVATKTYSNGRSTVTISGGATFTGSSMNIAGSDVYTNAYVFPVDGDVSLVLQKGTYTVDEDYKLLPGCTVDLASGASLTVNEGKTLAIYESFTDTFNANLYPSNRAAAELVLHGGSTLRVNGTLGGHVRLADDVTEKSYAKVILASTAVTTSVTKETSMSTGSMTAQEFTNTLTLLTNSGASSDLKLAAGTTYYGTTDGWTTTNPVKLPGDIDHNDTVNVNDLNRLLTKYGLDGEGLDEDVDNNGTVNINDLNTLLTNYGQSA